MLVLNTGRSKGALMDLLKAKEEIVAVPDVIITAVGTKVTKGRWAGTTHAAIEGGRLVEAYDCLHAWGLVLQHAGPAYPSFASCIFDWEVW